MGETRKPTESAARVRRHRDNLRKQGLKPVTLWLPDRNDPAYIAECRRQSLLTRNDPHEQEILDWIEAVYDDSGWTA